MHPRTSPLCRLTRVLFACLASTLLALSCSGDAEAQTGSKGSSVAPVTINPVNINPVNINPVKVTPAPAKPDNSGGDLKDTGGPKIQFKTTVFDFGAVNDTEEIHYSFEFTNTGDGLLVFEEIKPSCGCTTTTLVKMEYVPGESGAIELNFHPKGYGSQTKTITVKSNSTGNPRVILYIKAKVTPFVQFDPRSLRFAEVPSTEGREEEVTVICRDTQAVFSGLQCTNPNFEVEWTLPPNNGTGKFRVRLKPGAPRGNVINKVKVEVQGVPKADAATIRHTGEFSASAAVFGEIIIDPIFLAVGRVDPGKNVDKSVELRRPNDEPFQIISAEMTNSSPNNLEVSVTPKGAGWTVRVQGDSGTYEGLVRGTVVVQTDVVGDETLRISVMGAIRQNPKK